jgi:hypothetical protein
MYAPSRTPIFAASVAAIALMISACRHAAPSPAPTTAPAPAAGRGAASPTNPPQQTPPGGAPGDSSGTAGRSNLPATPPAPACGTPVPALGAAAVADPVPRPYASVIRGDVKTRSGLFKTHRIGNCLYFEIPRNQLGKEMILTTEIEKTTLGNGYGGQAANDEVVRWERRDNRILLRGLSYTIIASDSTNPITRAVENANYAPIIRAFPVASWGPDSAAVIDVTTMYTTAIPAEIGVGGAGRGTVDASRTFLNSVAAFPENIEVRSDVTYANPAAAATAQLPGLISGGARPSSTLLVHWSMVKLPDQPMMPRLFDSRVGYFSNRTIDFSRPAQKSEQRTFITRYRLECSDQKVGNLCVPKKPITYYVDPATPTWLVPWVKRAVESWQPAFEAAGFYKGIIAKEAPSREEDPDWSIEDARYSVVDWLPSTTENAIGPHLADPRSGEILSAHLQIYHNVMNLNRNWYWVQAGAVDPRARKLPFPDSLAGRMMQFVIAHETGHSLGFQHNMKASSLYPVDSIRNRSFLDRMGHTPTLMDYSRFNYVVQPEDNIPVELLIPKVGPYDIWATKWGYTPIPEARTPDDERETLDRWAREQDAKPWLRFSTSGALGTDPGDNTEAVGDADAVKATELGIRNIKRLVPMLIPATTNPTDDNSDLRELYTALFGQWVTELRHVAVVVGGVESQEKYGSQPGARFTPLRASRQQAAVRFLNDNCFATPTFFLRPEILSRIEPNGALSRISSAQNSILTTLLQDARINRLIEFEATAPEPGLTYDATRFLSDVRRGIWSELAAPNVVIDAFRRALQSNYIDQLKNKFDPPAVAPPTGLPAGVAFGPTRSNAAIRGLLRLELKTLDTDIVKALGKTTDTATRAHLENARVDIQAILDPRHD